MSYDELIKMRDEEDGVVPRPPEPTEDDSDSSFLSEEFGSDEEEGEVREGEAEAEGDEE